MRYIFAFAGPPEDPTRFVPLLIVLGLAFIVPIVLAKLRRIPVVVGEIVFGVLVGPSILGWVSDGPTLTFMSDIGLAFLMFLAGMEIDFDLIFKKRESRNDEGPDIVISSVLIYGTTLFLAVAGAFLLRQMGITGDLYLMVFVLSATSLGVLLPILKDRGLLSTKFGQIVFFTAMLADFVTVILLTVHLIVLDKGFDLEIFSLGLLFLVFSLLYRIGPGFVRIPSVGGLIERLSGATVQIKVRGAIALLMAFVVLAEFVDAELILGAFLGGMVISLIRRPEDEGLIHNLEAFGFGFFIPVFFIMVGVDLDIQSLLSNPELLLALPAFLFIATGIKLFPMFLLKKHFSWRDLFAGGLLLNTHLSLEVAIAVVGLRAGLFNEGTSTTIIVFSVLTVLLMPLLFGFLAPATPKKEESFSLILGATDLGITVAQQLRAHGDVVRFLVANDAEKAKLADLNLTVLDNSIEELDASTVEAVRSALILSDDDQNNLELSRLVRSAGVRNVIAQVKDPKYLPDFDRETVKTFSPALERATMISMMARNPNILDLLTTTTDARISMEVEVNNREVVGKRLRELNLPGDLLILAIRRKGELLIPRGGTSFELRDSVSILGSTDDVMATRKLMAG